ncbi:hypothetical protein [Flexivirga caeni]|uniref:Recombinase A n=1 Tax=Flexivirga caeni TaxID=2294115 RepID=A0A3M9M9Q8_9MICO|nr:hypothetical protein [Flexivirga caeni]RNI22289.1 hypothetical protein EFY87_09980 [Flexivirga caeni]
MAVTTTTRVAELHELLARHETSPAAGNVPVHPELVELFPRGLRTGAVYSLHGSMSAALALLAGPSAAGSWCAVVGVPDLGIEAAADWGVWLDRIALIPRVPAGEWTSVVAALVEVSALVVAAPPEHISPGEVSRLLARLRTSGSTLVVLGNWPRAVATLTGQVTRWDGLYDGHGHLRGGSLRLEVTERQRTRYADLELPVRP